MVCNNDVCDIFPDDFEFPDEEQEVIEIEVGE